jgi:hypothetical protein
VKRSAIPGHNVLIFLTLIVLGSLLLRNVGDGWFALPVDPSGKANRDVQLKLARPLIPEATINFPSSAEAAQPLILVHARGEIKLILFSASTSTL